MRRIIPLLFLVALTVMVPLVWAQVEVHEGTIFHSVIGGGNITAEFDFNTSLPTWAGGQIRFLDFNGSGTFWDTIGFHAPAGSTLNITDVNDGNCTVFVTVPGLGTTFTMYSLLGEPTLVTGVTGWTYASGVVTFIMNGAGTAFFDWYTPPTVYTIEIGAMFSEVDVNLQNLLFANCTDAYGAAHNNSVTFTVTGAYFKWNQYTQRYEAKITKTTAQTIEFGILQAFHDKDDATAIASIIQNVTVTWTTGVLDRLIQDFQSGNWIGGIWREEAQAMGGVMVLYTFILGIFSIGVWMVVGVYGVFLIWMLGWGIFASLVHGQAQVLALALFALGCGIMIAKLYLDRRTT